MNPLGKKNELIKKFKNKPKLEKFISFKELNIEIHLDTFKYYKGGY